MVKREQVGITVKELTDSWGGSEPVQLPPGTETPIFSPPNVIDPVDPVSGNPGPGNDITPNAAAVEPPAADNNLLLFGGLAAFYFVAFAPFKSSKISGTSSGWMLPGLLLAGGLAFLAFKKPNPGGDLAVLNTWADINRAPGKAADDTKQIFASMSPAEIHDTKVYLVDYMGSGIELPETDPLYQRILEISRKYQIFN